MPIDPRRIEVIDDATAELLRRQSGMESLATAFEMFEFATRVLTCSVREQHPDWDESSVSQEVARRLHGEAA